ncbi:MAG: DUF4388 domain-containing protein [bacterium]|nr:hypothetical protein [Deltaproteobacteria bacterium]MCP4905645.1 DUF4388 domain-containing protein [bacterium]
MSVALHGNLRDFGIAEIFQLIGQQRKTGTLIVAGDDDSIFLSFDEGGVVRGGPVGSNAECEPLGPQLVRAGYLTREQLDDLQLESERSARPLPDLLFAAGLIEADTLAEVQHLLTRETVFDVMRRKNGDFDFTAEQVVHDTKPENLLGAEQILMDGLRMLDEWQTFAGIVPSEETIFRRVGHLAVVRAVTKTGAERRLAHADRVLQLVDGRMNVRRIIGLSRIGTFEATRALAELRQAGVIDVAAAPSRLRLKRGRPRTARAPIFPMIRAALVTGLPILVLGFFGHTALERADGTGGLTGSAIPVRSIDHFGSRYEAELVRKQLEVHFFQTGRYPEQLQDLLGEEAGWLDSLTPSRLADYYYVVRDDEVVLLAPID